MELCKDRGLKCGILTDDIPHGCTSVGLPQLPASSCHLYDTNPQQFALPCTIDAHAHDFNENTGNSPKYHPFLSAKSSKQGQGMA